MVADVMHARMRVGDQVVKGSIGISADFTAKGFEGLVRSLGLRFSSGQSFRKRKQIEAMQNPTARKRKLSDDRVESAKQREKRKSGRGKRAWHNLHTLIFQSVNCEKLFTLRPGRERGSKIPSLSALSSTELMGIPD